MMRSQHHEPLKANWKLVFVTILLVNILLRANRNPPGGVYSFDDPNPHNRGMPTLAHKPLFQVFRNFNTTAMITSMAALLLLLVALVSDGKLAEHATMLALHALQLTFSALPGAFLPILCLYLANYPALVFFFTLLGLIFYCIVVPVLCIYPLWKWLHSIFSS